MTVIMERPTPMAHQDLLIVTSDPGSLAWREGERIEAEVFIEKDYVASAAELALEYAKYMPTSEFAVVDRDYKVAGSTRLIYDNPAVGFKTLDDIEKGRLEVFKESKDIIAGLVLSRTMEVGTLAVDAQSRRSPRDEGRVAMGLYGIIGYESAKHGCDNILASIDSKYLERFQQIFGSGVQLLGPATDYMGSPTTPIVMNREGMYANLARTPGAQEAVSGFANIVLHD